MNVKIQTLISKIKKYISRIPTSLKIVFFVILIINIYALICEAIKLLSGSQEFGSNWSEVIIEIILILVFLKMNAQRFDFSSNLNARKVSSKIIVLGFIGVFSAIVMVGAVGGLIECFIKSDVLTAGNVNQNSHTFSVIEKIMILISVSVTGPIVEEIVFRGIIMEKLWEKIGLNRAILFSSIFFGMMHFTSVITVLATTLAGIILAYTYAASKNLINGIIAHGMYNFVAYISVLVQFEIGGNSILFSVAVILICGTICYGSVASLKKARLQNGVLENNL